MLLRSRVPLAVLYGPSVPASPLTYTSARSTAGGLGWGLFAALGAIVLAGLGFLFVRLRAA